VPLEDALVEDPIQVMFNGASSDALAVDCARLRTAEFACR
jgi:hypothetical protein